jgi:hypothetical protein
MGNKNYGRKEKNPEINKENKKLESSMHDIFNNTISSSEYIPLNDKMINEL